MLNTVLLWHMHQPYYVNPLTQTAMMPWVRLHSVKGYLDMIDTARRYPGLRTNFNFTPVLVLQILELAERRVTDLWEEWSRKDPADLTDEEKARILENFFKINWDTCIFPYPRYKQLLEIRGRQYDLDSLPESIHHFTDQDYRDLQTWYNLAWCGFSACNRYPELKDYKNKGAHFTEEEKHRVLDIHQEILTYILQQYREAQDQGVVEITTTPFFHPIMPVVYDTDFAHRCMPWATLPQRFSAPEDVLAHLRLAQEQHERVFGRKARGLWPSEGSVCPEILPFLREVGIEYFCTDEGVLFNSLNQDPAWMHQNVDHLELFQAWSSEYEGARVKAMFRERPLSDFVGFNAARNSAEDASGHLLHHLEHLADVVNKPHGSVLLALDGENAWEAFPDGGEAFLARFYEKLLASPKLTTRRLGDYLDEVHDPPLITRMHSGSWINSDFDIWIGDPEENQGWEWIAKTRDFLTAQLATHSYPQETVDRAWREIYAAEGSDWFWWYGPDFQTDCDFLFDELFRTHLQNVYRILGAEPPKYLEVPICLHGSGMVSVAPSDYIHPRLDGGQESYYDWLGAGNFDIQRQQTAMFQADRIGRQIYYGFSETHYFFRLDTEGLAPQKLVLSFHEPVAARLIVDTRENKGWLETSTDGVDFQRDESAVAFRTSEGIVLSVPMEKLGWQGKGEQAGFMVQLLENDIEKERYPERGLIEFSAPSPQFKLQNWFI